MAWTWRVGREKRRKAAARRANGLEERRGFFEGDRVEVSADRQRWGECLTNSRADVIESWGTRQYKEENLGRRIDLALHVALRQVGFENLRNLGKLEIEIFNYRASQRLRRLANEDAISGAEGGPCWGVHYGDWLVLSDEAVVVSAIPAA
jgi:hypothetical protein